MRDFRMNGEKPALFRAAVLCLPLVAVGALLALLPIALFPTCPVMDGTAPMRCHWTGRVLTGYGTALAAMGILMFFCRGAKVRIGIAAAALITAASAALVPTHLVGMCGSPAMRCNTGTYPGAIILLVVIALICVGQLVYLSRLAKNGTNKS